MHLRMVPALTAGVLAAALVAPVASATEEPPSPGLPPTASQTAAEHAEDVLELAEELATGHAPAATEGHATLVLNQLMEVRDDLSPAERQRANVLLARPTRPGGDGYANYTVREAKPHCGGAICVHYVRRTDDAPPRKDSDDDRVPNAVEQTLSIARHVHGTYVDSGYRRPDPDGRRGGRRDKVDIYLADLGGGFYGYCTADPGETGWHVAAYCTVDDDFRRAQFPRHTPLENRKVTLAHEYFHAVQFAYDAFEDAWLMEATATWAEDEVYDGIDDNRQFVADGQLGLPRVPLDRFSPSGSNHYGNWLFFRHLTERMPEETGSLPTLVLQIWERLSARTGAPDDYSTQAISTVLENRETTFTDAYSQFALDNRDPADTYDEGEAYEAAIAWPRYRYVSSTAPDSGTAELDHLTSLTVRFTGQGSLPAGSQLKLDVDLPAERTAPAAKVVVHFADGTIEQPSVTKTAAGITATVPFATADVADVELVLVNASRTTDCWQLTNYACSGDPRHDNRESSYTATVVPPTP